MLHLDGLLFRTKAESKLLSYQEVNMPNISAIFNRILFLSLLVWSSYSVFATPTPADFAKDLQYHEAKISPDGKYIGLILVHEGKRRLAVVDAKTFESVGGADFGDRQQVDEFFWATDERLIIKIAHYLPWQEEPVYAGELFAVDYNGKRGKIIFGFRAGEQQVGSKLQKKKATRAFAEIISLLPDDENNILISSRPWSRDGSRVPTAHRLNINSGRLSGVVASGPVTFARFFADRKGDILMAVGMDRNVDKKAFVLNKDNEWDPLSNEEYGEDFLPLAIDDSGKNLIAIDNLKQDKTGVLKINLKTGKREGIYTDEKVDIEEVSFNSDLTGVYAARLETDYPNYVVFNSSSSEGALFKELLNTFKGYRISVTSKSSDDNLWIIYASNDTTVGAFYLYDKKANKFSLLFNNFSHIPANFLSQSIPVSFKASDGMDLHGFITYPAGIPETQNVPLITLVHGGPHARDYWAYDRKVQLLASQGYAVLRVNFRGSTGYGRDYQVSGYGEWGRRIQQDIIDGTKWIVAQGGIEQSKICIMGSSFGGYSAMQSAILAPDLFKCVVATAGVYDLPNLFVDGDIPDVIFGQRYLELTLGSDMELLREFSPTHNLSKLKAPVLIAHGKKDRRAPFEQAVDLKEKLGSLGKTYEWLALSSETHGFYDEANRAAYFEKVSAFLAKYLK